MRNTVSILYGLLSCSFFWSCSSSVQPYTDLNNLGYKGKVKSLTTKVYRNIGQNGRQWEILNPDSVHSQYSFQFNKEGNVTERTVQHGLLNTRFVHHYAGKEESSWVMLDAVVGDTMETGKIVHGNGEYTETTFDHNGKKTRIVRNWLNKNQWVIRALETNYGDNGRETGKTEFSYEDDGQGLLKKVVVNELSGGTKITFEFTVLERDPTGNPLKTLRKKDGVAEEIKLFTFEYW